MIGEMITKLRRAIFGLNENEYRVEEAFRVAHDPEIHVPEGSIATGELKRYEYWDAVGREELQERFTVDGRLPVRRHVAGMEFWTPIPGEFLGEGDDVVLRATNVEVKQ